MDDSIFSSLVAKLKTFHWSGNIRQLFKALEAWVLTREFEELPLTVEHFPIFKGMVQSRTIGIPDLGDVDFTRALQEDADLDLTVSGFEKAVIAEAVKRHKTLGECCKALNVSRSTFDAKRRRYGLL